MIRRSTWFILAIFIFLAGFAWFNKRYQADKVKITSTPIPTKALASIYNLEGIRVNEVTLLNSEGDEITFINNSGSDQWSIINIPADQADSFLIGSNLAQLFSIEAQETLTQTPPLDSMGLLIPAYTISIKSDGGEPVITYVGSITPIGNGYYLRVDSGSIAIVNKMALDNALNMLTSPPLTITSTPASTDQGMNLPVDSEISKTPTP
jgi:hypothetical protein